MSEPICRRRFLGTAALLPALTAALNVSGQEIPERLPPVRAVTRGPRFHWFGYYDKLQFDPSGRLLLSNEVDFEHRSPTAEDVINVGMVDLRDGDRWTSFGTTRAWNWQQGCMLQWLPGDGGEVIWNDREGDRFVCHILNPRTGAKRTLPNPIYAVSPDGAWAVAPDFRRLNDTRPGYGYAGIPDPHAAVPAPDDAGIWKQDLRTGDQRLMISFADVARIAPPDGYSKGAKHWFNHLLVSPDGARIVFLHRWRGEAEGSSWKTRMLTVGADGKDLHVLIPSGRVSHFVWRDPAHILAYAGFGSDPKAWRFQVFKDRSAESEVIEGMLPVDGHCTYLPAHHDAWILCDAYPDKERNQNPYLLRIADRRRIQLGRFRSPPEYKGEWRCDLHPRASCDGRLVCIDSPHGGQGRQLYALDLGDLAG